MQSNLCLKTSSVWLTFGLALLTGTGVSAQNKSAYSIETDPSTFAFGGYAAHVRFAPAGIEHWVFGIGIYALDIPALMTNMESDNKDQGWKPRLERGLGLFAEYFFDPTRKGWYVGGQLAAQDFKLSNANTPGVYANFTNSLSMAHAGYRWYPNNQQRWYVQPWMGIGYTRTVSGQTQTGTQTFTVTPVVPFATLHIGYEF